MKTLTKVNERKFLDGLLFKTPPKFRQQFRYQIYTLYKVLKEEQKRGWNISIHLVVRAEIWLWEKKQLEVHKKKNK